MICTDHSKHTVFYIHRASSNPSIPNFALLQRFHPSLRPKFHIENLRTKRLRILCFIITLLHRWAKKDVIFTGKVIANRSHVESSGAVFIRVIMHHMDSIMLNWATIRESSGWFDPATKWFKRHRHIFVYCRSTEHLVSDDMVRGTSWTSTSKIDTLISTKNQELKSHP